MDYAVHAAGPGDYDAVLRLNQAAVPAVSRIDHTFLEQLAHATFSFRVIRSPEGVAGFMLAFGPDAPYGSPNFLWFKARYARFAYVDRVVVAPAHRGNGAGRLLYEDIFALAATETAPLVACEVNVVPPNPGSLRFHDRLGFREVGQQDTDGGTKRVSLMVRAVG